MKVALYIVTYKGYKRLVPTLNSIDNTRFNSLDVELEVNIINNHTDFRMPRVYRNLNISVLHNVLRPDFSCGHLSRNWNQALLHGFEDLDNPRCDVVVCSQDDSIFNPDWLERTLELHRTFDFIHGGHGDQFHSYLPSAVKKVGLWDERFCGLSRQAADYFWRCVMHNKEGSTIQDSKHYRVLNPIFPDNIQKSQDWLVDSDVRQIDDVHELFSDNNEEISSKLIKYKYGYDPYPWTKEKIDAAPTTFSGMNFITYPYFEKKVELAGKNYLT